jgi:methyl-accepting chemotaxis protein
MKAMQQVLGGTVAGIQRAVDSVRIGAQEIASGNMDLSSRTEHHASALEETAATLENLGRNVQQTAVSATHANALSRAASSCAASGRDAMTRVEDMMNSVHASSKRIAEITVEVDGIAFQTNILALNAAVEAARAGPQGAGFAVVAGEVRNLAQRSAVASKTIKKLIDDAAREVAGGQSLVHDAGATMREIADSIDQVSDTIAAISAAAMEQSAGLAEVNIAVAAMEQVTQQNAALVEESAAAAGSLHEQADTLARLAARFIVAPPVAGAQRALAAPLPQLA